MNFIHKTPAPCLPIDLSIVRQQVKQDIQDDDVMLSAYLASAVDYAQNLCQKQFVSAKFSLKLAGFASGAIKIPHGPMVAVQSITYYDTTGALQTLSSSLYTLDFSGHFARISLAPSASWPATQIRDDAVEIQYIAGYVAAASYNATTNTISLSNWPDLAVGAALVLSNSGGSLPTGLTEKTQYYVQSVVSPGVYTLATSIGGVMIDLTNTGSGLQFAGQLGINLSDGTMPAAIIAWLLLRTATAYEHRAENVAVATGQFQPLPYVDRLLDSHRLWM